MTEFALSGARKLSLILTVMGFVESMRISARSMMTGSSRDFVSENARGETDAVTMSLGSVRILSRHAIAGR